MLRLLEDQVEESSIWQSGVLERKTMRGEEITQEILGQGVLDWKDLRLQAESSLSA